MKEMIIAELNKGITQRDLAKRVGFSHGTIQKILFTSTKFTYETRKKVADYFRIPVSRFYDTTETVPSPPTSAPAPTNDLLTHTVKMQDIRIAELQKTVNELQAALQKLTDDTGHEIGEIKNRMIDTASSGDYHRLDPTRPFTRN